MKTTRIEISSKTIIFTVAFLLFLWFLFQIRNIIVLFFIGFILATAVGPLVRWGRRYKIPLPVIMFTVYLLILFVISFTVASLIPAVITQTRALAQNLPDYFARLDNMFNLQFSGDLSSSYLAAIPSNLFKVAAGAFGNILNIFLVFFIAYYLVVERPHLHQYLAKVLDNHNGEQRAERLFLAVEKQVGGWIRGQLLLMLIIGIITYLALLGLGIPYALPLAVLAGLLEAVPNLGPTIAAVPAILMGLTISPVKALGALAMAVLIQQLENNFVVPKIMQSATGTKPLVTTLALLIGFTLGGVAGAILAMPIYLTLLTIYKQLTT